MAVDSARIFGIRGSLREIGCRETAQECVSELGSRAFFWTTASVLLNRRDRGREVSGQLTLARAGTTIAGGVGVLYKERL